MMQAKAPWTRTILLSAALSLFTAVPAAAETTLAPPTPLTTIDYSGFRELTGSVEALRAGRLLTLSQFMAQVDTGNALLLDARSPSAFARGHIAGAVNLPFSDFTAEKLANVIGADRDRPILIYCNNNFTDNVAPVALKSAPLALNIPTFINLVGYGYGNVWELGDAVSMDDPAVRWVSGPPA